jgi:L-ascorbate metabolism protein UlaG (beta-lactamase superfamily)
MMFAGSLTIGAFMVAMIWGHWYLVKPSLDEQPLNELALIAIAALVLQLVITAINAIIPVGAVIDSNALPPLDCVLVSHDHYDHLNAPSVRALLRRARDAGDNPPLFIVPAGLGKWFRKRGFPRVRELDWWETLEGAEVPELGGLRVHGVPAQHWSQRIPWLINRTRWNGFVVEGRGGRLLVPGDTGYSRDFADIRDRLGAMTVALLPIGAYEPRWFMQPMHTNPEDAVRIHRDLGAAISVAMHWGTFALTDEPFEEPPRRLRAALKAEGIAEEDFWVMGHGETRSLSHVWGTKGSGFSADPRPEGSGRGERRDARPDDHIDADLGA